VSELESCGHAIVSASDEAAQDKVAELPERPGVVQTGVVAEHSEVTF
jgi:hypothetical protein